MNTIFSILSLERNPRYVDELESSYSILFPPIFKLFVQTFEFGRIFPAPHHTIVHPNEALGFNGFEQTLERKMKIYKEADDYFQLPKMLPIIPSGIYGSGICLGLDGDEADKLFINFETIENRFEVVSPNIFKFISELKEVPRS